MNITVSDKEESQLSILDFDDIAKVTLVARVTGINEYKDENGNAYKTYQLEATITDVDRENVSLRTALERGLEKQDPGGSAVAFPG